MHTALQIAALAASATAYHLNYAQDDTVRWLERRSGPSTPSITTSSSCSALPTSPLTNEQQAGNSLWGTLCQPTFPQWLGDPLGTPLRDTPWGNRATRNADATAQDQIPVTGVVRSYNLTVSRGQISPDGVLRDVILINGQYPAPVLEANWGDWFQVNVFNNITGPEEGTAMHWHGMLQRGRVWNDGTPAVSQCPIAPGQSYTYEFRAEQHGTSMYHAHYSAQYTGGAIGPMHIYGPNSADYDIDLGAVMLSDWQHIPYFSMVQDVVGTDLVSDPPTPDNALINGRGRFGCSFPSYDNSSRWLGTNIASDLEWTCVEDAELAKFRFQSGKVHRLRLMNTGADGIAKFSIDGHTMTVIATDYVPNVPYDADFVTLGVGQRTDILVKANASPQSSWAMRTTILDAGSCGGLGPFGVNFRHALATIYYEDADTTVEPEALFTEANANVICDNDALTLTEPEYKIKPAKSPFIQDLVMTLAPNETGSFEWAINGQTYRANFDEPLLYQANEGNTSFPNDPQWNVYDFGDSDSIVFNVTNLTPFPHPMHLHGHNFYVLNVGAAGETWDGSVINPENPMRRDVQIVAAGGYMAVQFDTDNPGVWPFHCHVAWHLSGGMSINAITKAKDIKNIPENAKAETCDAWYAYTNGNVVDQIDSGS